MTMLPLFYYHIPAMSKINRDTDLDHYMVSG